MDSDKSKAPEGDDKPNKEPAAAGDTSATQDAPADALSRTPDDLEEEQATRKADTPAEPEEKKLSPIRQFFRKVNIYLLIFILVLIIAGIVTWVTYLNSTKAPEQAEIESQQLTTEALKQLANTDASVGSTNQTLTIQGNAIIAGQTLMRGNLNVAGNFQTGGSITGPSLTISGATNIGATQASSLQVSQNVAVQGSTTMRDLSVSGASTFSGPMTASQITTSRLVLSGNATLQIPNHISFTGPTPNRSSINGAVLGSGGSASISGSDTAGTINVNSGNSPSAGCFVQITFAQRFPKQPHVIVSPVGQAAGQTQYYVTRSETGFSLCTANTAPANQTFAYDYFVTY